jgi:hypothetical protein
MDLNVQDSGVAHFPFQFSGQTDLKIFRCYKAKRGLAVLKDLELRTSLATELNDPFELSPNIDSTQFD